MKVRIVRPDLLRQMAPPLLAAMLLIVGLGFILKPAQGEVQDLEFAPGGLRFLIGSGGESERKLLVDGFRNGQAAISTGPLSFQADTHYLLRPGIVTAPGAPNPVFFWRQKSRQQDVSRIELPAQRPEVIDLRVVQAWQGEIVEAGFLFQDPQGRAVELTGFTLQGESLASNAEALLGGWFQFEPWTLKSANMLFGGAASQRVHLPLVLIAWLVLSIALFAAFNWRSRPATAKFAVIVFILAWLILDLRWSANRVQQGSESMKSLGLDEHERLTSAFDGSLYEYALKIRSEVLGEKPRRILLVADESVAEYILFKTKYHLLPHASGVKPQLGDAISPEHLDYVLFMSNSAYWHRPGSFRDMFDRAWDQLPVSMRWREQLELVDAGDFELLFAVTPTGR
jgi:hypothetical protein